MDFIIKNSILGKLDNDVKQSIIQNLPTNNINNEKFYEGCIQYFMSQSNRNFSYEKLAVNLSIFWHEEQTESSFIKVIEKLQNNKDILGQSKPLLNNEFYEFIMKNNLEIEKIYEECLQMNQKFELTYFGWKTLQRSYLLRNHEGIQERIEHLFFRIALFLHLDNYEKVKTTFSLLRQGKYIHATPTLYHAGLINPQMASCFLIGTDDSVSGIYKTLADAATISKYAGGLGIHISNIRGENSYIYGTNGISNGIMPMLRVYNATSRYIDQCFDKDTLIICENSIKKISELQVNIDKVLTRDGSFQKVLKVIQHDHIKNGIIEVTVQTPLKEIKVIMTKEHDLLMNNENYETIENGYFGNKTTFIDVINEVILWSYEDLKMLGYIYGNCINSNQIKKNELIKIDKFFDKYNIKYIEKDEFYEFEINEKLKLQELKNNEIPKSFYNLKYEELEMFLFGYLLNNKNQIPLYLQYRIGLYKENELGLIKQIISIEKEMTLYDLEIENNHNYQTLIGLAHNGGGKRKGAFAMYLEPWHSDIMAFIKARRNIGNEEDRARDLFYGIWMCDYFMEQVEKDGDWYLFSEIYHTQLQNLYGQEFKNYYNDLVNKKCHVHQCKAREIWLEILKSQIETGTPYILYKDTCNQLSNQKNLGTIKSSNLCCEIIEYSDNQEYAVCNLSSISLKSCLEYPINIDKNFLIYTKKDCFYCKLLIYYLKKYNIEFSIQSFELLDIEEQIKLKEISSTLPIVYYNDKFIGGFNEMWNLYLKPKFNFNELKKIVDCVVENLNIIIDKNFYPLPECKYSNLKNRPIGIGVQGLADVFMEMLIPYESKEAQELNKLIFEHLYYYSLLKSNELSTLYGTYDSYTNSPISNGKFHFNLYDNFDESILSKDLNWNQLRNNIIENGIRNSLLIAPMPTASTSQILGNTESFEPLTSNYYLRRTNAGEFYVINSVLKNILIETQLWNDQTIENLIINKGSIQNLSKFPNQFKEIFKTVWEMSSKNLIDMASMRQYFIDQSQSFNIYMAKTDMNILNKIHFYGWKKKLKTGCYYLRTRSAISSQNFTIDPKNENNICESCSA
jgi:ribonucleoside-diphosphate reductase alpha subunit